MTNTAITVVGDPTKIPADPKIVELAARVEQHADDESVSARAKRGIRAWKRLRKVNEEVFERACMNWSSHRRDLRAACRFADEGYFRKTDLVARGEDGLLHYNEAGLKRLRGLNEKILTETLKELETPEVA